jgi:circadian clock protein KaiC
MDAKRVSTGIAGLDAIFQGGLLSNRSYLIGGDAGTGKTTAGMQFLLAGLKQGEKAIFVTVDERPAEILQSGAALNWNLQKYVQEKSLVILDASPYFSGRGGSAGEKNVDLTRIISDLGNYAKRMEATRVAIDPITPLFLSSDSTVHVQENARMLMHLIQAHLTTTNLLTAQMSSRSGHDITGGIEEFVVSGVLILKVAQNNGHFLRTLNIKKMRGTPVQPAELPFKIVTDIGLVLDGEVHTTVVAQAAAAPALEFFELPKN